MRTLLTSLRSRLVPFVAAGAIAASLTAVFQFDALVATLSAQNSRQAAAVYDSTTFGYEIDLPANWRRSSVLSKVITGDPIFLGHDLFTIRTPQDEASHVREHNWMGLAWQWTVVVIVKNNPTGMSAMEWAQDPLLAGRRVGQTVQSRTFAGQNAAFVLGGSLFPESFYVPYKGRMYQVAFIHDPAAAPLPGADEQTLRQIMQSFRLKP